MTGMSSHQSQRAITHEWLTPPEILRALGPFDLDPCAPVNSPWYMAREHYTIEDDGLSQPWHGYVWMNPPYGRHADAWLAKLADHGQGIALIFARTETAPFANWVWNRADGMLFLKGRLFFHRPDGSRARVNAGAPSVLVAYGKTALERLANAGLPGFFVQSWFATGLLPDYYQQTGLPLGSPVNTGRSGEI